MVESIKKRHGRVAVVNEIRLGEPCWTLGPESKRLSGAPSFRNAESLPAQFGDVDERGTYKAQRSKSLEA